MLIVGLTGGIGSGKSVIANVFDKLGIPVYNSDAMAKYLMNHSLDLKKKLIESFGNNIYDKNGKLDKAHLASVVFSNKNRLEKLNALVHPEVNLDFKNWLEKHKSAPYVLKEAAILIESGYYKEIDKVILVTASEKTRIARVIKRDNCTKEDVVKRIRNQWTDEKKSKYADYIIYNDENKMILKIILKIHKQILNNL
ncbi:MAG: dephospho-CoA kinase [Chlorobi bacterium]|nr:dephospho-CoA kinase [Chlorobiota bacterium]